MKYPVRSQFDIELGKDGSSWKHGYIPENAAAVALKNHKSPKSAGAAHPGGVKTGDDLVKRASEGTDYSARRAAVLEAARQGRATHIPAGAGSNNTARIHIDGHEVGQSSVLGHHVQVGGTVDGKGGIPGRAVNTFGTRKLEPKPEHMLPESLRVKAPDPSAPTGPGDGGHALRVSQAKQVAAAHAKFDRSGNYTKPEGRAGDVVSRMGETRSAYSHLASFNHGDRAVVTDEQGKEHLTTINHSGRSDGSFGSFESHSVGASLGPGRYTYNINNHQLSNGKMNIRKATSHDEAHLKEPAGPITTSGKNNLPKGEPTGSAKVRADTEDAARAARKDTPWPKYQPKLDPGSLSAIVAGHGVATARPGALNPSSQELLARGRAMHGTDLSKWSTGNLKSAAKLGDVAAKAELAKRTKKVSAPKMPHGTFRFNRPGGAGTRSKITP